jgi:hypothetical protein
VRLLFLSLLLAGALVAWHREEIAVDDQKFDQNMLNSTIGCIFAILAQNGYDIPDYGTKFKFSTYFDAVNPDDTPRNYDAVKFIGSDGKEHGGLIIDVNDAKKQVVVRSPVGMSGDEVISILATIDYKDIAWLMRPHKLVPGAKI